MITPHPWPSHHQKWDRFRAFHVGVGYCDFYPPSEYGNGPLVMFDTGELICLKGQPDPGERNVYGHVNIELAISDDMVGWRTPTGLKVSKAWLKDSGSQWFLIDRCSGRAVRIDGTTNRRNSPSAYRPGIPDRFQSIAHGYIGGPGCLPVGCNQVVVRPPIKIGATSAQLEHITGLTSALRAMLTLRDDPILEESSAWDEPPVPFDMVMGWESVADIPREMMGRLLRRGVDRPILKFDYLTKAPQ